MNLDFSEQRWEKIRKDYTAWWDGELKRPLIHMIGSGRDPGRAEPKLPSLPYTSHYDLAVPAGEIADRWLYDLEKRYFLGDGFPSIWPNFGPGVMAAFMGLELQNGEDTVWFHQAKDLELAEIELEYLPDNIWLRRVSDIYRAGTEKFEGLVHMGMTDLGGNLDIAASFRQSQNLLMDLFDVPGEVERIGWQSHKMWWKYFEELDALIQKGNKGYTSWTAVYSAEPSYMLQCDFCYMIGKEMFDQFVKPELAATCKKLVNPIYHLDGPGQLNHLDSLLEIPELKAVQWVPGAGQPPISEWPEVYRKIRAAGKNIQFFSAQDNVHGWRCFEIIADQLGSAEGLIMIGDYPPEDEADVLKLLEKYGASHKQFAPSRHLPTTDPNQKKPRIMTAPLTSRERVKRAIHFQGVDHIPHHLPDGKENDILWLWLSKPPDIQPWTVGNDGLDRRIDAAGVTWVRPAGATMHGEKWGLPITDITRQAEYVLPDYNAQEHFVEARRIVAENKASANPKYCLGVMPFSSLNEGVHNIMGLDHMFAAYYEEPEHLKALVGRMAEAQRESIRKLAEIGCDGVMGYDDWGLQDRLMVRLEMIEEFFKEHYSRNWRLAHELGMDTWMHSCGYIVPLLPKLHEWGLNVIQEDQQENAGLENLDAAVGGKMAFWCPVDIQKTMVEGSVEDIRNYVKRMMDTIGNHNGGLCSMAYSSPETVEHTPEKTAAMCAAFREFGVYQAG